MPEQIDVSPLLDGFTIGTPVNDHYGVCCYPAVKENSERKYIVKVISIPASQTQLDALLITGAYKNAAEAGDYFRQTAGDLIREVQLLQNLSRLEGFLPYEGCQVEPMQKNRTGYRICLLSGFRLSLERYMHRHTVSHLEAVNLGIDICAALAACRKAGMMYIDLKPSNIFISNKKEYKIGDLGFTPLDSMKYSSMPEKYRSCYTPPELLDDFSVLNGTADTYALGMILYQIFNHGALPQDLTKPLPAPDAADEEMAGILLKACAPDPADRWEDPTQMGQALIDYMQRGTINDVPIMEPITGPASGKRNGAGYQTTRFPTPPEEPEAAAPDETTAPDEAPPPSPEVEPRQERTEPEQIPPEQEQVPPEQEQVPPEQEQVTPEQEQVPQEVEEAPPEEVPTEAEQAAPPSPEEPEAISTAELEMQFRAFAQEPSAEETPAAEAAPPEQTQSSFFDGFPEAESQTSPAPEQALPIFSATEIEAAAAEEFSRLTGDYVPETEAAEEEAPEPIDSEQLDEELEEMNQFLRAYEQRVLKTSKPQPHVEPVVIKQQKKKRSAISILFLIFFLCLLLAASVWGYMYYSTEYLQTVNGITIEEELGKLTVHVDSDVQESLLSVVCTDPYGNSYTQNVRSGIAEFTKLTPGTFYTIQVKISGLHKLTTPITEVFTTEGTTNVAAFTAAMGSQDGSVTLSMIVEGHEPDQWQVFYSADGEPEYSETFTGHTVTVNNLVLGKLYTFRLEMINSGRNSAAGGQNTVQFTPAQAIGARNLSIVSCLNGELTVQWDNTASIQPEYWWVHCYGGDYDESQEVTGTQAVFTGISSDKSYTIEVCAKGMTQTSRVSVSANPITLTDLQIDESNPQELVLSWQFQGAAPEGGWMVMYTLDNSNLPSVVKADGTTAIVAPRIPGAVYHFTFQADGDVSVFGGSQTYTCPAAPVYTGHQTSGDNISCRLLVTPEDENWTYTAISNNSSNHSFAAGQPLSVVLQSVYGNYLDYEDINILYVFRDTTLGASGELIGEAVCNWHDLWNSNNSQYAELDIPVAPTKAGDYVLDIYFNGMSVASANLTIY